MLSGKHENLWNSIKAFAIDDPLASVKYSDKLAFHNNWSKEYASRVIEEYKKFIFLCCVLPQGASPSKPIDEAWHLHLTYTQNYWKELCEKTLRKEIHHFPSRGGPDEKEKHIQWYNETLEQYRHFFGESPPPDIWTTENTARTNNQLVEYSLGSYKQWYKKYIYILIAPFFIPIIVAGTVNPYQLPGPQFLVFYMALIGAIITYLLLIRSKKKQEIRELIAAIYKDDANIYQIARFVYGRESSLRAAVVDLVERGVLGPVRKGRFIYYSSNYTYLSSEQNPLAIGLLKNIRDGQELHFTSFSMYYDEEATYHSQLSNLYKTVAVRDYLPAIIGITALVAGIARIIQGEANDKPVSILVALCAIYLVFLMISLNYFPGRKILRDSFTREYQDSDKMEYASAVAASVFVFLGLSSLAYMSSHSQLSETFRNNRGNGDSASWGGCGSSGCGSDGGGCGGGGCGGCGGGD